MPNNRSRARSDWNVLLTAPLVVALAFACRRGDQPAPATTTDTAAGVPAAPAPAPVGDVPFTTAGTPIPPALTALGTNGEDLYDLVKVANWTMARTAMDSLTQAVRALPAGDARPTSERARLTAVMDTLARAVTAHDRAVAMHAANEITHIAATLTDAYKPATPTQVTLLDYYGRELEIWALRGDLARLTRTAKAIRETWQSLKPAVVARQGGSVVAQHTDSLLALLSVARAPSDYGRLATPFLDDVDQLELVFVKP